MTQHSLLGASGAHRWLNCPGSFALSKTAPHRPASIWAATGTVAHELIEKAAGTGVTEIDRATMPLRVNIDGQYVDIDQPLIDGVNTMLAYINRNYNWRGVEFRVSLDDYFVSPPPVKLFGTLDAGLLDIGAETLEVVDYKNGAGVSVTPVENPQLLFYAAGAYRHLTPAARDTVKKVKLTIVQPNAPGLEPVRSWETSLLDVLMWVDDVLVPGVHACAQPDAPLVTGEWCRFCPVSHACPELHKAAIAMAKQEFIDLTELMVLGIDGETGKKGTDELADKLDMAELAELWITRVREFALAQIQSGVAIPGWGLVPTRPSRRWSRPEDDTVGTLEPILTTAGIDTQEIFETRVKSPAQLEKTLRGYRHGRKVWAQDIEPTLVEKTSTGVKLGRIDRPDAKDEFDVEE